MKMVKGLFLLSLLAASSSYAQLTLSNSSGASLKLRSSQMSFSLKDKGVDCPGEENLSIAPLSGSSNGSFRSFGQSFSRFLSCSRNPLKTSLILKGRFSEDGCKFSDICKQSLLSNPELKKQVDEKLNKIIAKDHAKNLLNQNLEQLERLELLKKYAAKEFNLKVPFRCTDVLKLDSDKAQCTQEYLGDAFELQQDKCESGLSCYREDLLEKGVQSYAAFKKEKKSGDNEIKPVDLMLEYLNSKIDQKNIINYSKSPQLIEELSNLVTSVSFKKLGEEEKMKSIFRIFKPEGAGYFGDPVLGFDFNNNDYQKLKKMDTFKEMMKIVNNKALTKSTFTTEFNKFRKKRAEVHLSTGAACTGVTQLNRICSDATKLANGDSIFKNADVLDKLASQNSGTRDDLSDLTSLIGLGFSQNELDVLADANRCQAFGLMNQSYSLAEYQRAPAGLTFMQDYGSNGSTGFSLSNGSNSNNDSYSGVGLRATQSLADSLGTSGKVEAPDKTFSAGSDGSTGGAAVEGTKPETARHPAETTNYNDYQVAPQPVNSGFNSLNHANDLANFGSGISDTDESGSGTRSIRDGSSKSLGSMPTADERVSDLLKKLAAAEAEVARVKAEGDKDGDEVSTPKKEADGPSEIDQMKAQIADLRKQVKSKEVASAIDASSVGPSKSRPQSASAIVGSSDFAQSPKIESKIGNSYVRSFDAPPADPGLAGSANASGIRGTGRSVSSGAQAPLFTVGTTKNADGSQTTVLPSGDVVLSLDGLSPEKAALVLTMQFKELGQKKILIEEGGVIKEVSPVNSDGTIAVDGEGNLTINKIVRGKRTDSKFAGFKVQDVKRAPASALAPADLKRQDDRDRYKLRDLQAITDEASKK